jgi:hypothetical protein
MMMLMLLQALHLDQTFAQTRWGIALPRPLARRAHVHQGLEGRGEEVR